MNKYIKKWTESSLILKIIIGLIIGVILGLAIPQAQFIGILGEAFVGALKSIAPILVFLLVCSSLSKAEPGVGNKFKGIIGLYLCSSFLATVVAVIGSLLFPVKMVLTEASSMSAPGGLGDILTDMILGIFANPLVSLSQGDYLGILFWAFVLGVCLKKVAKDSTKDLLVDFADALTMVVTGII